MNKIKTFLLDFKKRINIKYLLIIFAIWNIGIAFVPESTIWWFIFLNFALILLIVQAYLENISREKRKNEKLEQYNNLTNKEILDYCLKNKDEKLLFRIINSFLKMQNKSEYSFEVFESELKNENNVEIYNFTLPIYKELIKKEYLK